MFRNTIEWVGTHPLATGLLAIIGLLGTAIGVVDVYSSSERDAQTSTQLAQVSETTQRSEQAIEATNDVASDIAEKLDGLERKIQDQAAPKTAIEGFVPAISELPYDLARPKLIEAGWIPNKVRWQELSDYDYRRWPLWSYGFEEVEACAGTGRGECMFVFHNGAGTKLNVVTFGEVLGQLDEDGRRFIGRPNFGNFRVGNAWTDEVAR